MAKLSPHVVLITGASDGIGAALAREYAAPGVTLGLLGRNEERLAGVAEDCRAAGATVETLIADVATHEAEAAILSFDHRHKIDLLLACAGVTSGISEADGLEPWDTAEKVAEINFTGALRTIGPLANVMAGRGSGQIAGIGSLAALTPMPSCPAYSAAKAGLETYLLALRRLLRPYGVGVSIICLGYVETGMSRQLKGRKPFLTTPERVARKIRKSLCRNPARIIHPPVLYMGIRLLNMLPEPLALLFLPAFAFTINRKGA
ncbi:MAG: SDR family NAD(P)-dependent oxidoreductase [Parvibaculum sp.]|jgi:short-subunit dehydrogenase